MAFQTFCDSIDLSPILSKLYPSHSAEIITEILKRPYKFQLPRAKKCDKLSSQTRAIGNSYLNNTNKNMDDVIGIYTKSLFQAKTNLERSYCFGNRSYALFKLGMYRESIKDIDEALNCGYPIEKAKKLQLRKAQSLIMLGKFEESKQYLNTNKNNLDENDFKISLYKCFNGEKFDNIASDQSLSKSYPSPTIEFVANDNIKSFSASVSLRVSEKDGRGIIAVENIGVGDVIAVETPYAYRLGSINATTHCYQCLQVCANLTFCGGCFSIGYCSDRCKTLSQKISRHDLECGIMPEILSTYSKELGLLAYGVVSTNDKETLFSAYEEIKNRTFNNDDIIIDSQSYLCAANVETNEQLRSMDDLSKRCLSAVFLALCFQEMSVSHDNEFNDDYLLQVLSELFARHLQGIPCNAHTLSEFVTPVNESIACGSPCDIGNALYPALSMINHSCSPNVIRITMSAGVCVLKACARIGVGEQIFDNYSIHFATMHKEERLRKLKDQYHFDCACQACRETWPTFEEQLRLDNKIIFICPNCRKHVASNIVECSHCGLSLRETFLKFNCLHGCLSEKMDLIVAGKFEGVEAYLIEFCSMLCDLVKAPNILFHQTTEMLKILWTVNGCKVSSF